MKHIGIQKNFSGGFEQGSSLIDELPLHCISFLFSYSVLLTGCSDIYLSTSQHVCSLLQPLMLDMYTAIPSKIGGVDKHHKELPALEFFKDPLLQLG